MERGDHIRVAEIGLDGGVGRSNREVNHDAVHVVDYAVDEAVIPDFGLAHFDG